MKKVLWLAFLLVGSHARAAGTRAEFPSESIFQLDDAWTTSEGKPFHLRDLKGAPAFIAMIYTSCRGQCPLIVEEMKKIESRLSDVEREKVHFVLLSFDPGRDSPAVLSEFAKAHGVLGPHWILSSGSANAVRRMAVALDLKFKRTGSGDFQHSNLISLIDGMGSIQFRQTKMGESLEGVLKALRSSRP